MFLKTRNFRDLRAIWNQCMTSIDRKNRIKKLSSQSDIEGLFSKQHGNTDIWLYCTCRWLFNSCLFWVHCILWTWTFRKQAFINQKSIKIVFGKFYLFIRFLRCTVHVGECCHWAFLTWRQSKVLYENIIRNKKRKIKKWKPLKFNLENNSSMYQTKFFMPQIYSKFCAFCKLTIA